MQLEAGETRTFSSIIQHHMDYVEAGEKKKDMALFKNCIKPCLMTVPDPNVSVLEVIPIPELHVSN